MHYSGALKLGFTLEAAGEAAGHAIRCSNPISLKCSLGTGRCKTSPGDSKMQQSLRTMDSSLKSQI